MTSEEVNEIELFHHANRCLEFFDTHKQDNCFPGTTLGKLLRDHLGKDRLCLAPFDSIDLFEGLLKGQSIGDFQN